MQIVSQGDNLHEMSKPVFWEKIRINLIYFIFLFFLFFFLTCLAFNKLCQAKTALISYVGNEGAYHFIFCYYSEVYKCIVDDVMAIFS